MNTKGFNIHDLNFILTFAGFSIFTSVTDSVSSVLFRAIAVFIAMLCIFKEGLHFPKGSKLLNYFLIILFLMTIKVVYGIYFGVYSDVPWTSSKNQAVLFAIGVVLIPIIALLIGYKKINWTSTFYILFVLLSFTILKGLYNVSFASTTNDGRFYMNIKQSPLTFGDCASYLCILSACLLRFISQNKITIIKKSIVILLLVFGLLIGLAGVVKAGSRGPFIACLVGLLLVLYSFRGYAKLKVLLALLVISLIVFSMLSLESIAPILYERMQYSIIEGDTSGRDLIFLNAIELIKNNLMFGTCPITLLADGFTSYHNCYLDVGVGLGIFGFIAYVILNVVILIRIFKYEAVSNSLIFIFLSSMFGFSATRALVGVTMTANSNYCMIMCLICIATSEICKSHPLVRNKV